VHVRPLAPLTCLLIGLALLAPAGAGAAKARSKPKLWATVNVCDTAKHPDTIGVRGSMPGIGRRVRMFMRFQVEFFRESDGGWHALTTSGDLHFQFVGRGLARREGGRNVTVKTPPAGSSYRLRGRVTFEWRRGQEIVRRAVRYTQAGHPGTTGADPSRFSAAECRVLP
jgi:hypothetical protein